MNSKFGFRQILLTFLVVVVAYFGLYAWIEHARHRKGPWVATFDVGQDGVPRVVVAQEGLGIEEVTLRFPGQRVAWTGGVERVRFDEPGREVPFGEVIYEDLTFLPGVVTFNFFGHLVEWMPRVMILNRDETPWVPGSVHELAPEQRLETPPRVPEGGTRDRRLRETP